MEGGGGFDPQTNHDNCDTKTTLVLTVFKDGNTLVGYLLTLLTNEDVYHYKHTRLSFVLMFHHSKIKLRFNLFIPSTKN